MASEIRVNKINSRTGVGTITLSPTGVDFTGIATVATLKATTGIVTTLSVTGTTTLNGNLDLQDNDKILVGTGDDLEIYHDGTDTWVDNTQGDLYLRTSGSGDDIIIRSADDVLIQSQASEASVICRGDGQVEIYHNNDKKLETTGVGASVTGTFNVGTGTSITSSSLIVNDVQYPTAGPLSNRNLIINGAMNVAQRGTSSTSTGYRTVDRFKPEWGGVSVTQSQQTLSSGSPYDEGFRYFLRLANTSVSSSASSAVEIQCRVEAQDLAQSGWNYKSASSYVTFSFWVRSSLAGTYYVTYRARDASNNLQYVKSFTLVADTWTKVNHTIPGGSNVVFNNDNGEGLRIMIAPHYGTNYTGSNAQLNAWHARVGDDYFPDYTENWSNTASATFDVTGVQMEVGEKATPFEHRSYGDELARCQRYFYRIGGDSVDTSLGIGAVYSSTQINVHLDLPCAMRTKPSAATTGSSNWLYVAQGSSSQVSSSSVSIGDGGDINLTTLRLFIESLSSLTTGYAVWCLVNSNHSLDFSAEL